MFLIQCALKNVNVKRKEINDIPPSMENLNKGNIYSYISHITASYWTDFSAKIS